MNVLCSMDLMTEGSPFFLRKMSHQVVDGLLHYRLAERELNPLIGNEISITHTGSKQCVACNRAIKKTFGQGFCFPCLRSLARCDTCILRPETCHYHKGSCREPEWAENHCLIEHVVYLANTTGLKVGITRANKRFERWGDQGALETIVFARVPERLIAGQIEAAIREFISDRTDWRALIKGEREEVDLEGEKEALADSLPEELQEFLAFEEMDSVINTFIYPVNEYPVKASTWNLDRQPEVRGHLKGIRGQYLFIGDKAINIRKYEGYEVIFSY